MDKSKVVDEIIDILSEVILSYIAKKKEEKQLVLAEEIPST